MNEKPDHNTFNTNAAKAPPVNVNVGHRNANNSFLRWITRYSFCRHWNPSIASCLLDEVIQHDLKPIIKVLVALYALLHFLR